MYFIYYSQVSVLCLEFTGKFIRCQLTQLRKAQEGRKVELLFCRKLPLGKFGSYLRPVLDYKCSASNLNAVPSVWISSNWTASILTSRSFLTEIVLDLTVIHITISCGSVSSLECHYCTHLGAACLLVLLSELPAVLKLSCQVKRAPCTVSHQHCIYSWVTLVPFGHNLKMWVRQRMMK